MKFWSSRIKITVFSVAIIAIVFFTGFYIGTKEGGKITPADSSDFLNQKANIPDADTKADFGILWEVWGALNEKFVPASTTQKVSEQEKIWGAAKGLADSLKDPHTVFMPPEDAKIFEGSINGNFSGVGMEIDMKNDIVTVVAPLKGSPAERAGILPGDKIIKIDGESTYGMNVYDAVKKIRGEKGTPVVITIMRKNKDEQIDIKIIRDIINIPTIATKLRDDKIFVISLYNFSAISPNLFREAIREFKESGSSRLILDLRGNAGGYLEAATDMASWFLSAGKIIVTEDYGEGKEDKNKIHRSKGYDIFNDNLEFVILVDSGSASASEILAGALKEHGVAKLVGTNTFGKGSVQELISISDSSSLKVTVARWLTPNGKSISDGGLTPDYIVEMKKEDREANRDPQMDKAIKLLLTK